MSSRTVATVTLISTALSVGALASAASADDRSGRSNDHRSERSDDRRDRNVAAPVVVVRPPSAPVPSPPVAPVNVPVTTIVGAPAPTQAPATVSPTTVVPAPLRSKACRASRGRAQQLDSLIAQQSRAAARDQQRGDEAARRGNTNKAARLYVQADLARRLVASYSAARATLLQACTA